ncbi:dCTP deaminase [Pseudomonas chlororaphis]|nr:dCTP deaminase [Pseudomonas chlororaphis]
MIITGAQIKHLKNIGHIVIDPYDEQYVEPNSYGFHLGDTLLEYVESVDARNSPVAKTVIIPETGYILHPKRFYLGHTLEKIGGVTVASELYANHSTAALGIWVQTSAPLGHVGAVINWTLEICVAQKVRIYPRMRLGKICFWQNKGEIAPYSGRYTDSHSVIASRSFMDAL